LGTPEEEERTVKHAKEAPLLQVRRCQSQDCEEEEERRTRKRAVKARGTRRRAAPQIECHTGSRRTGGHARDATPRGESGL